MGKYHEADIRRYFKDAFGYVGSIEESADRLTECFASFGLDMFFEGKVSPEMIKDIDGSTMLAADEVAEVLKNCLR